MMSRLISIDTDTKLPPEDQGCEYGYYLFDPLPPISTEDVCHIDNIPKITITNLDDSILRTLEVMLIDYFHY